MRRTVFMRTLMLAVLWICVPAMLSVSLSVPQGGVRDGTRAVPFCVAFAAGCCAGAIDNHIWLNRKLLMAAPESGGAGPPSAECPDSDDDVLGAAFDRACRAATIRAEARSVAQEALFLFAAELAPPDAATSLAGSQGPAEPSAAVLPCGAAGLPASSSAGAMSVVRSPAGCSSSWTPAMHTPKRKRVSEDQQPEPPSPEDDATWNMLSLMSPSASSSSTVASPLGRLRLTESPPTIGAPGSSSSFEMMPAVPSLPLLAEEENGDAATQVDSLDEETSSDDVMSYMPSSRSRGSVVVGVEPSAALQQPADTSNAESMPTSLDSVG